MMRLAVPAAKLCCSFQQYVLSMEPCLRLFPTARLLDATGLDPVDTGAFDRCYRRKSLNMLKVMDRIQGVQELG